MEAAIITVGEELLAGDVEDANATWLASELGERGVDVRRMVTLPDERATIATHVAEYSDEFDAVVVTGGIGGTPDDVTMAAVADAMGTDLVVDETARAAVEETLDALSERLPELDVEPDEEARLPAGSRPLLNPEGLSPGSVVDNIYVLPGIPREMQAMFETVAEDFSGDTVTRLLYTTEPEANITADLDAVQESRPVRIGCYPDRDAGHNRLKLVGRDEAVLETAVSELRSRIEVSETPVERDQERG